MNVSVVPTSGSKEQPLLSSSAWAPDGDFPLAGSVRTHPPGSEILLQGAPAEDVYFIQEGLVKLVWMDSPGKQTILALRWSGHLLGVAPVIAGGASPISAITVLRSKLQRIPAQNFLAHLRTNPNLAWKMHQIHSRELCEHLNSLGELACCTARLRLVKVFNRLIEAGLAQVEGGMTRVRLPLKQRELAELIGVTPEHLSRILRALSEEDLLYVNKGWMETPNPQALSMI